MKSLQHRPISSFPISKLFRKKSDKIKISKMNKKRNKSIRELSADLKFSLVIQMSLLTFSSMLFDRGASLRLSGAAAAAYWLWVGWIDIRRGSNLNLFDIIMIRAGYLVWIIVTILVVIGMVSIIKQHNLL